MTRVTTDRGALRAIAALGTTLLLTGAFWLFLVFTWNAALERASIVVGVIATCIALLNWPRCRPWLPDLSWRAALPLVIASTVAASYSLAIGVAAARYTARTQRLMLDQGQDVHRALVMLSRRENPYGQTALLDPQEFRRLLARPEARACLSFTELPGGWPTPARFQGYWDGGAQLSDARTLRPSAKSADPRCRSLVAEFDRVGMHYGPVELAAAAPFVAVLGKPGIPTLHVLLYALATVLLALLLYRASGRNAFAAALGLMPWLFTPHVIINYLRLTAVDILPVTLGIAALYCRQLKRPVGFAVFTGLSIGAKLVPGLLYAPALLRERPRDQALCASVAVLTALPFFAWEPRGYLDNVFLFPLLRSPDSTALAGSLSAPAHQALVLAVGLGLLGSLIALRRSGFRDPHVLAFWLVAHAAVLVAGTFFHNNYVAWLLPLVSLALVVAFTRPGTQSAPTAHAGPRENAH